MVSADDKTPVVGSGQRKGKVAQSGKKPAQPGKKSAQRSRRAAEQQDKPAEVQEALQETVHETKPEQAVEVPEQAPEVLERAPEVHGREPEMLEQVEAPAASVAPSPPEVAQDEGSPGESAQVLAQEPAREPAHVPAAATEPAQVSYQTITNAYGDYTMKSLEQTRSFFGQLAGARSFNRAFELQTEYARQTYETFVAESQRIGDLHCELTRQRLKSFEGMMTGMIGRARK